MQVIDPEELAEYVPANHLNMVSRRLIGREMGATKLNVVLAVMHPGGFAPRHSHENSEHCHYVLTGELTITTAQGARTLGAGMIEWIPPGEEHEVRNNGAEDVRYIGITAPPSP
ncbi:MAG: cupin domain-containing protein [Chloroflexi bacterium]|nr:cupin domain-containing protein [Chloroflexota bacterium]